jgi:PKD repeat protein
MKRLLLIIPVLAFILPGCHPDPNASFIVSSHRVEVYESIDFTNTSSDMPGTCEWDFGDGTFASAINASHFYQHAGTYTVTLRLYDHSRIVSESSTSIEVVTTALTVIVKEYGTEKRIPGASVILYPTQDDWMYESNAIVEGTTDNDGVVVFENLEPVIYFVDVWHENYNNYQLANEDTGWIRTDQLAMDAVTEFVAYVDYVGTTKSMAGKKSVQNELRSIERRTRTDMK